MKTEHPRDLDGRLLICVRRAQMISDALQAIAKSELREPHPDVLYEFGAVAEELSDEIKSIHSAIVAEDHARHSRGGVR